jgi:hypothetical protein
MKYTKQQLLGAIFQWDERQYIVVENGEDVQLKALFENNRLLYPTYTVSFLNTCLKNLKKLNTNISYEIY